MVSLLNIVVLALASSHAVSAFALFPWLASYINPDSASTLAGTATTTAPAFPTAASMHNLNIQVNGTGGYAVDNSTTYLSPTNGTYPTANQTSAPYLLNWNTTLVQSSDVASAELTSGSFSVQETSIVPSLSFKAAGQTTDGSVATEALNDDTTAASVTDSTSITVDFVTTITIVHTLTNTDTEPLVTTIPVVETLPGAGSALASLSSDEDITTYLTLVQTITVDGIPEPITTTVELTQTISNDASFLAAVGKEATTSAADIFTTTVEIVETLTNSNNEATTTTIQIVQTITDASAPGTATLATVETLSAGDEDITTTLHWTQTRYSNTSSYDHHHTTRTLSKPNHHTTARTFSKYKSHHYTNGTQSTYTPYDESTTGDDASVSFILSA